MPKALREANRPQCPQRDAIIPTLRHATSLKGVHWVSRALSEKSHSVPCRRWVSVEERVEPLTEALS